MKYSVDYLTKELETVKIKVKGKHNLFSLTNTLEANPQILRFKIKPYKLKRKKLKLYKDDKIY